MIINKKEKNKDSIDHSNIDSSTFEQSLHFAIYFRTLQLRHNVMRIMTLIINKEKSIYGFNEHAHVIYTVFYFRKLMFLHKR
jgi:hypothetical protein